MRHLVEENVLEMGWMAEMRDIKYSRMDAY